MKQLFIFIGLFYTFAGCCQMRDIEITLNTDSAFIAYGFSCKEILDDRAIKDNIGYVSRGIGRNNSKLVLTGDSSEIFKQTFKNLRPKSDNKTELVLIIRNLIASENIGTQNQFGYCNAEIEFAKREDTALYSLGIFHSSITERSTRVKYTHGKRIVEALEECLEKFNESDWKNQATKLIDYPYKNIPFDYKNLPPKGVYLNYSNLKRKAPFNTSDFEIQKANNSIKFTTYKISFAKELNSKLIGFVSDGNDIYMRINETHFLKSESYGKYIFFRGKIPTTPGNTAIDKSERQSHQGSDVVVIAAAAVIIGITAGIMGGGFFIASPAPSGNTTTNMSIKGVVIDTETDELKVVTDMFLYRITKPYPLMLKAYRKSRRKPDDKRKVIDAINAKF